MLAGVLSAMGVGAKGLVGPCQLWAGSGGSRLGRGPPLLGLEGCWGAPVNCGLGTWGVETELEGPYQL